MVAHRISFGVLPDLHRVSYSRKVIGERLIEVSAMSRGALQKRQVRADQKHQQVSSLHVKDWLKRAEILSLATGSQAVALKPPRFLDRVVFLYAFILR
jgi:hypothetical protein